MIGNGDGAARHVRAGERVRTRARRQVLQPGRNLDKRVVVREVDGADTIQIRPMAYVSLTIDHRALDGHQTNAWLTHFVRVIETWPTDRGRLQAPD